MSPRRPTIRELEELPIKDRIRTLRGRDTQAVFAAKTGFSVRQVKRWEGGAAVPTRDSAEDLATSTGYPARIFLPPPEPSLREIGEKLDLVLSLLQRRNGSG